MSFLTKLSSNLRYHPTISPRIYEARRVVRCPQCVVCLGHPAVQHDHLDGPVNPDRRCLQYVVRRVDWVQKLVELAAVMRRRVGPRITPDQTRKQTQPKPSSS